MSLGSYLNKSTKTIAYRLLELEQSLDINLPSANSEPSVVDVKHLFPLWILERSSETSNVSSFIVDFVQSYYDWLYSSQGYGFGRYELGEIPFLTLVDIDETPVQYLERFSYSYTTGFSQQEISQFNEDLVPSEFLRNFIKGIRDNFYQKKGTESSYEYFFRSLYGVEQFDENWIEYPKKFVLRLNGGAPYGYVPARDDIGGLVWEPGLGWVEAQDAPLGSGLDYDVLRDLSYSVLNVHVIQDSNWYQDFSYLIKTEVVDPETGEPLYSNLLKDLVHPAGLKVFYEVTLEDYIPPVTYEEDFQVCEEPMVGNYFPYRLSDTTGFTACLGCSGSNYLYDGEGYEYGLDNSHPNGVNLDGKFGFTGATFNMPTHKFPNWSRGISCDFVEGENDGYVQGANQQDPFCVGVGSIGNIYIGDFVFMCNANESPNLGLTGCTGDKLNNQSDCDAGQCYGC